MLTRRQTLKLILASPALRLTPLAEAPLDPVATFGTFVMRDPWANAPYAIIGAVMTFTVRGDAQLIEAPDGWTSL